MKLEKKRLLTYIVATSIAIISFVVYMILAMNSVVKFQSISIAFFVAGLACIYVPLILKLILKIDISFTIFIIYECFILYTIFFGSIWTLYDFIPIYDMVAHAFSGVMFALIGYELLFHNKQNKLAPIWLFIVCFSISCMAGSLWEIYEFVADSFGTNCQRVLDVNGVAFVGRDAILDTMEDTICNAIGAVVGALIVTLINKKSTKNEKI